MSTTPKSILVISHSDTLRYTRAAVLETGGYKVTAAASDDEAMTLLKNETFDLVLIGRKTSSPGLEIDERLREQYPNLSILKIDQLDAKAVQFASRNTDPEPAHVLLALKEMLGE